MKKSLLLIFSICLLANTVECVSKKKNRFVQFIKGSTALSAAIGLGWIAYKSPINELKGKLDTYAANTNESFWNACRRNASSTLNAGLRNAGGLFGYRLDSESNAQLRTLLTIATIVPAWELGKYGIKIIYHSLKGNQKVEETN